MKEERLLHLTRCHLAFVQGSGIRYFKRKLKYFKDMMGESNSFINANDIL